MKEKGQITGKNQYKDAMALRQTAENGFLEEAVQESENLSSLSLEMIYEAFHKLQENQIALEMQKDELRRARAEKDESLRRMAGAVAHHFNNQLTVVMGSLALYLNDLPKNAKNSEKLHRSMKAAQKAAAMSRQMLNYLGQTPGSNEAFNLSEACFRSLARLQPEMPKEIVLNCNFPDSGPLIHADRDQIHQILTSLVTNAWESVSGNHGTLSLTINTVSPGDVPTAKCIPAGWQPKDISYVCLEISDTGCGVANMDVEKIFDPFFTTKFTGRGMGLPVALKFVKNHDGCITVDSIPGDGSVFSVYLPVIGL